MVLTIFWIIFSVWCKMYFDSNIFVRHCVDLGVPSAAFSLLHRSPAVLQNNSYLQLLLHNFFLPIFSTFLCKSFFN